MFAPLAPSTVDGLARKLIRIPVAAGDVVNREGDAPDAFYVIAEGSFAVTQVAADGSEAHLRTLGPDDVFGEIGLLTGKPRSATVTAETDGTVVALDGSEFLELVGSGPGVGNRLLGLYAAPAAEG
jgi:CRP-like cAMP-binding protein